MPVWGQPQPYPWTDDSSSGDVNMTLALTGPSGAGLPPAAREAIQHAVAQAVPGIGESSAAAMGCAASCPPILSQNMCAKESLWAADSSSP